MLKVSINNHEYEVRNTWADITIDQAAQVAKIKMPDCLKEVYKASLQSDGPDDRDKKIEKATLAITIEQQVKSIPRYYGQVLEILSNVPHEVIKKISSPSVTVLYQTYLQDIVEGILYYPNLEESDQIEFFEFQGEKYYLPVSKEIMGKPIPMVDLTALEFTESADILIGLNVLNESRDLTHLANLIAILCRPKGELYDERKSADRAKQFTQLTMDIVWRVFFSLITPLVILNQFAQISSIKKALKRVKDQTNLNPLGGTEKS